MDVKYLIELHRAGRINDASLIAALQRLEPDPRPLTLDEMDDLYRAALKWLEPAETPRQRKNLAPAR